jgi:hypothetical protein
VYLKRGARGKPQINHSFGCFLTLIEGAALILNAIAIHKHFIISQVILREVTAIVSYNFNYRIADYRKANNMDTAFDYVKMDRAKQAQAASETSNAAD